ncbi:argininosuccinate lyase [Brenneria goodwinii]|uniref:Argininosuccinate lyase n=1 Tax=Brenneria goodwinii TaxID=1109412 RepID=A0AAE8JMJ9_9GAMM|nr:argininosuccinate lyase [Brenneria goodwinii]ATA26097.1 hypothetical protein AWC36_19350 [Brenneria goodwinii]RLM22700.1 argininosuccinate lyase [Brenneria goodwinii]
MSIDRQPSGSPVSPRLSEPTAEEICRLIYLPRLTKSFEKNFFFITQINAAHLIMLNQQHLLPAASVKILARGLLDLVNDGPAAVKLDPFKEDAYLNYESCLVDRIGMDHAGRLHMARSRNDILATIDRLQAREGLTGLIAQLLTLRRLLVQQAKQYADAVMPGYTHLQPAQPITYGFWLAGIEQALARDTERLAAAYAHIDSCPLGACALAGTTFAIDRQTSASALGFSSVTQHTLDAVASRDGLFEIMSAMTQLATTWSRIAQDYFIWVTNEFNFIDFPDSVAGTSSIMPQKKNPVALEYLKGRAAHVLGMYTAAMSAQRITNFSHSGDANRESISSFPDMLALCADAVEILTLLVRTGRPNRQAMLSRAYADFCTVTDLADAMVKHYDISFREAHHIVGAVVHEALAQGLTADRINTQMIDKAAQDEIGRTLGMSAQEIQACLDPVKCVQGRLSGGPSAASVNAMIADSLAAIADAAGLNQQRIDRHKDTADTLRNALEQLSA